ncbi:MAG: transcriptional regulator NrdR [Deltaproteobacteria bacterium]|nr:transcriptional regulator NrdR [Deltaproteobacteria bacterium]
MFCPSCGNDDLKVIDSRSQQDAIKRRRACISCGYRFTTFERIEKRYPMVRKKDGSLEKFILHKIRTGLENAFRKRKISGDAFELLIHEIDAEIASYTNPEIESSDIGTLILAKLSSMDQVAYVRFASVYCEVNSLDDFLALLSFGDNSMQTKHSER